MQVVSSPTRICDDCVCCRRAQQYCRRREGPCQAVHPALRALAQVEACSQPEVYQLLHAVVRSEQLRQGGDSGRVYRDNWLRRIQEMREMGCERERESCTCAAYDTVHDPACQCQDGVIGAHACSHCSLGKGLRAGWTVERCRSGISARLNVHGCGPEASNTSADVGTCR